VNSYTYNLWRSDGTSEGTYMLTETGSSKNITGSSSFISFNSKVYFIGTVDGKTYLIKTNGTLQETQREKNPTDGNFVFASTGPNNDNRLVKDSLFLYYINDYDPYYAITCRTDGNGKFESIDKAKDCIQPGIFFGDGHHRVYTMVYRESPSLNLLRVIKDYSAATMNDVAGFYGDSLTVEYKGDLQIRWFDTNKSMCDTLPSKTGNRFTFRNYFPLSSSAIRYTSDNKEGARSLKANLKIYNIPNEITIVSVQRCNNFLKIFYKSPKPFSRNNKFFITFYKTNTVLNRVEAEKSAENELRVELNNSANNFMLETTIPSQTTYLIGIPSVTNSYKAEVFANKQEVTLGDSVKVTALFYGTPPFNLRIEDKKYENIQRYLFEVYVKPTKNHTYNLTEFRGACGLGSSTALLSTVVVSSPCAQNYIHEGVIIPMNYKSSDLIRSRGTVSTSTMTGYQSNSIELLPGFLADKGAVFQAKTGGCN
jgi:ELWxxDGT repeat protein